MACAIRLKDSEVRRPDLSSLVYVVYFGKYQQKMPPDRLSTCYNHLDRKNQLIDEPLNQTDDLVREQDVFK